MSSLSDSRRRPARAPAFTLHRFTDRLRCSQALTRMVVAGRCARTRLIEQWLNIDTSGPHGSGASLTTRFADPVDYETIDYRLIHEYLKPVPFRAPDVFVDIGCGAGRLLCLLARRKVGRCIGVEADPALARLARANAERLRGRKAPVEVWQGDAASAEYSDGTLFWLLNPFGARTLAAVLERIARSLVAQPRPVRILYVNPVHEEVLHSCPWLTFTGRRSSPWFSGGEATYWSNRS